MTKRYVEIRCVGEGAYGAVFEAVDTFSKEAVAVKKIKLKDDKDEGLPNYLIREIAILRNMTHPNIVSLRDTVFQKTMLSLIFEFVPMDLRKVIDNAHAAPLDLFTIKALFFQILQALAYCHRNNIIHRDVKPQNVLVTEEGIVKLADFGLARPTGGYHATYAHDVVTLWYRAPELLAGSRHYTCAVDVWAAGCILAEMINGVPLFAGSNDLSQLHAIFSVIGTPTHDEFTFLRTLTQRVTIPNYERLAPSLVCPRLDECGLDLLQGLLEINPGKRLSAHEALAHPFFDEVLVRILLDEA